jgi:hypothetical protein
MRHLIRGKFTAQALRTIQQQEWSIELSEQKKDFGQWCGNKTGIPCAYYWRSAVNWDC